MQKLSRAKAVVAVGEPEYDYLQIISFYIHDVVAVGSC